MDIDAKLPQDLPTEAEDQLSATETVAAEVSDNPQTEEATQEQPEEAAAEPVEASTEVATEPEAQAEAAPAENQPDNTIVATPDVAPARSKLELARIAKEALIEQAKELADSTDWRKATEAQRTLMEEWRGAGYAGKELNDKLWDEFRGARDTFFTRREEHYKELRERQAEVIAVKRQIIQDAREATAEIRNWVATSTALDELMDRWKAAGNAGRENEQVLWEEFNGIRRDFRNRRKADLAERRAKEHENAEDKRKVVEEAQAIAAAQEYTRENSDRMRQLNDEYKAIGYAGRPANDTLWQELRTAQNAYWDGNSAHRDQRRAERLQMTVERKSSQIEHLKEQNETLMTRLESTLNPEKVAQLKRWIAENEEKKGDLEGDIDEIKKQI